jgi:prepilin-type N-terminal cleavage/methylation domain-containing protein
MRGDRCSRFVNRSEDGFTLIEILLAVSLMSVVLVITAPVVTAFYDVNQNEQQTYTNENSVILASEKLTQYVHEAVAPCPTGAQAGCPTAPFTTTTGSSLTFYADTNNPKGPSKVVITMSGSMLSAVVYQATGSCPFNGSLTTTCVFSSTSRNVASVSNLSDTSPFYYLTSLSGTCTTTGGEVQSPTASQVAGVCVTLQTTSTQKGQSTAFQTLAFALAPTYNGSVG